MAKFTIEKKTTGNQSQISITDYTMEPLVSHWNHNTGDYAVYKLEDYTDDLARAHGLYGQTYDELSVNNLNNIFNEIMATEVTPATGRLEPSTDSGDTSAEMG